MMKTFRQALLLLTLMGMLVSCSSAATPAVSVPTGSPTVAAGESQPATGYPAPSGKAGAMDAYPVPPVATQDFMGSVPEAVTAPEPKEGLGVVTGRLVEASTGQPYLAPSLLLGTMVFGSDPNAAPPLVGYSEETDPRGVQDRSGKFYFTDIKPGTYGIVIWTPGSHTLVNDAQGNTAQVTVEAGKVVDLGDVFVP